MNEKINFTAYCLADRIDITRYLKDTPESLIHKGTTELYYQLSEKSYLFILSYGVVVFSNMSPAVHDEYLAKVSSYAFQLKADPVKDDLMMSRIKEKNHLELSFDTLTMGRFDHAVNKMIMMHLAQSVALDHYNGLSQTILTEIKSYTNYLQIHGKVKLGSKKTLQFIGKALQAKNSIAENLYILDSPETTWEDEYLDRLHRLLVRHFELVQRYREIDNTLKIVEDNLSVYAAYNNHRESSRLEWIIIILIVIEVVDTFWSKLYN